MLNQDELSDQNPDHVLNDGSKETSAMNVGIKRKAMEGEGMGGQSFGETVKTPSGDDPANPSRNSGYSNEYFRRTEPSEENTANNNFKSADQEGAPDYDAAQGRPSRNADDEPQHIET